MSVQVLWFRLSPISNSPKNRPTCCPHCTSAILQRWGRITKPVSDTHELEVEIHRYRCCDCKRTFRAYPEGIDRASRTVRLRQLAALTWALGLSLDEVANIFDDLGLDFSRTTIWRDGVDLMQRLPDGRRSRLIHVLSPNGNSTWIDQHSGGVILVLELKKRKKILLEMVDEVDVKAVRNWLQPITTDLGLEVDIF
jgi:transposase